MMRKILLSVIVAASAWLLAASSGVNVVWHGSDAAKLRLSWVARPERIEECRELTAAELEARPAHMRQARECMGGSATYSLSVTIDEASAATDVLEGGGIRNDRAIFVLREYPLDPGPRHVQLRFARIEPAGAPMDSANISRGSVPRELILDTVVHIPASGVALVSFENGRLLLRLP